MKQNIKPLKIPKRELTLANGLFANILLILALAALSVFLFLTSKTNKAVPSFTTIMYVNTIGIAPALILLIKGKSFVSIYLAVLLLVVIVWLFLAYIAYEPVQIEDIDAPSEMMPPISTEEIIDPKIAEKAEKDNEVLAFGRDFMVEASKAFSAKDGLIQLLDTINKAIIKCTNADGGAILLVDDFDDIITVKTFHGEFPPPYQLPVDLPHKIARVETSFRFAQFNLGETIFGLAATSGKAELITDPLNDVRFYQNEPEDFLKLGSYIISPMIVNGSVIGVIALARKASSEKFNEEDFSRAEILSNFASGAVQSVFSYQEIVEKSELTRESAIACNLQKSIHGKLNYNIPGTSFAAFFNVAEGVCGDYFDVIPCRKDRIAFVLADVAGKGMNSLIVMVMIRASMQLIVNTQKSAATILSWTNRGITGKINIDHFASLVLANYDSEKKIFQIASAGNTPVLLYHSENGEIEIINEPSDPIGVDKNTEYKDTEIAVKSGDIVLLYTDGLIEAVDAKNRQYGVDNIKKVLLESVSLNAQEISNRIKKNLQDFCGNARQHDDQTLMVVKIQ